MKNYFTHRVLLSLILLTILLISLYTLKASKTKKDLAPQASLMTPGEGGKEEGEDHEKKKALWWESIHRTAPGGDWKKMNAANAEMLLQQKKSIRNLSVPFTGDESFANGKITGQWSERGNANIAGSTIGVSFVPETDEIYTITAGGSLWKGKRDGSLWQILNDDIFFDNVDVLAFQKPGGGIRILAHTTFGAVSYSDDDGKTFTNCGGKINDESKFDFYAVRRYFVANDALRTIYLHTFGYDFASSDYVLTTFKSTNQGASFTELDIVKLGGYTPDIASEHMAYNSNTVYSIFISQGSVLTTKIDGSTITSNAYAIAGLSGNCVIRAVNIAGTFTLYMLVNNINLYSSTNDGASWTKKGNLPTSSWGRLDVSATNASTVFAGAVNAIRSSNGGANWSTVNEWFEYYNNIPGKLHADIMEIKQYYTQGGTPFTIINNHGGCAVSYDNLVTTKNISLTGLYNGQYYDVLTNPAKPNEIYGGTQDQGWHIATTATTPGILNMTQQISGDYGHMALTGNNKNLWSEYPGGWVIYYTNPAGNVSPGNWQMSGSALPLYGWILPTATVSKNENGIYIAGGNINGGSGSYLVRVDASTTLPVSFTAKQFNYDFRAASGGSAGISAIEPSVINTKNIFVGTENGLFYYTKDSGSTWLQSSLGTGPEPWYLYGNSIYASKKDINTVWYAGSGYSNAPVWESTNGGKDFTARSTGLPQTLVYEICANDDETLLFAGTAAGPYVYVREEKKWYSLTGVETPLQDYVSVEYISSSQTVRFGTFGRGIWDFHITALTLPVTLKSFTAIAQNKNALLNWTTSTETNTAAFHIQRSTDGIQFNTIITIQARGTAGLGASYNYTDINALSLLSAKTIYYRLQIADKDGKSSISKIENIQNLQAAFLATISPNPVRTNTKISITNAIGKVSIVVKDMTGKQVWQQAGITQNIVTIPAEKFAAGTYIVTVKDDKSTSTLKLIKQ